MSLDKFCKGQKPSHLTNINNLIIARKPEMNDKRAG